MGPALFAMAIQEHIVKAKSRVETQIPHMQAGGLDLVGFCLDDGAVAGEAKAVKLFCDTLRDSFAEIGLEFRPDKSLVMPTVKGDGDRRHLDSEFGSNNGDGYVETGNFKDREYIDAFVRERVAKSRAILEKAGKLEPELRSPYFDELVWVTVRSIALSGQYPQAKKSTV